MLALRVYEALVEVSPLPGCELFGEVAGAMVNCYVGAASREVASVRIADELRGDRFKVVRIEHCYRIDLDAWRDSHDHGHLAKADIEIALAKDAVIYGDFDSWENPEGSDQRDSAGPLLS